MTVSTVKLNNGKEVAAKIRNGDLCAIHYVNRTQAQKAVDKLGQGWRVHQPFLGPVFYAEKISA